MPLIKNRVLNATLWSFLQRGGSLLIGFIANMVLARLLEPEDFGCLAIIICLFNHTKQTGCVIDLCVTF